MSDANPFAELFALLTPERFLNDPRATGKGVRIAVLDTGIDRATLQRRLVAAGRPVPEIPGVIFRAGEKEPLPDHGSFRSDHGTIVADIILHIAPEAELFSAMIFEANQEASLQILRAAIQFAVKEWRADIINLSAGIDVRYLGLAEKQQLLAEVERSYFQDVLIVASAHNLHPDFRSIPADFSPSLLSVNKGEFRSMLEFAYRLDSRVEFQAYSRGYLNLSRLTDATSWAAPHMTGIVARLLSLHPRLKPFEVKTLLYWLGRAYAESQSAVTLLPS